MVHATPGPPTIAVLSSSHRPQRPTTTTRARSHRHTRTHSTTQRRKRERERESKKGRENRHHRERGKRGTKEGSAARLEARVSIRFDSAAAAAMDAGDAWGRSSSSSSSAAAAAAARRLQSRYDLYMGFDDADAAGVEEVEARGGGEAYNCPFCGEDFDFVAFCCHVDDEHAVEAKSGLLRSQLYSLQIVKHISTCMSHLRYKGWSGLDRSLDNAAWKRRVRKISSGSHSLLSLLRKDLRDGSLQSFLGGSSYVSNPPAAAPDPFLSSLICSLPVAEPSKDLHSDSSDNNFLLNKFPDDKTVERAEPSLSEKDQKERAQRSKFVRGLVLSTILEDDNL
uniref:Protein dehydration-induced 19 C-terminal domain-containing protein n=1 Tax=Oryza meridionalis TaxID=40149 RepID=A0A0E0DQF5_9ORYZ